MLFLAITLSTISCNDDDNDNGNNQPESIATIAGRTENLSILVTALTKANLVTTLSNPGTYTVFAPTNAAFTEFLRVKGFANLDAVPTAALREILLNHVISTKNTAADLSTKYLKTLAKGSASTDNNLSLYVNKSGANVRLNGVSSVTTPDIQASNGVIHVVDAVIDLPTVVTFATSNADFSSLVSLLNRDGQPNFVNTLLGTGPFTVFAPTNAAFTALTNELAPATVSADNITKVLQYHVVSGNVLAASLTEGQVVTPVLTPAQTFTIGLAGGAKITDASARVSNIVATDVQATNGVIHVINKVLLPRL
jgi:uncharacterized surface protein with fasciclin (FAS1) repeats